MVVENSLCLNLSKSALPEITLLDEEIYNGPSQFKGCFISMGELERYFDGVVPVNLWRGMNIKRNVALFDFAV